SINAGLKPGISLTFDDGPNPEFTEKVLGILKRKNVTASFFIIGKNIKGNEALLKKIYTEGHIIGNHSMNHTYWFNSLPGNIIAKEIVETEQKIEEVIGVKPIFYRTPFGLTSPNVARGIKKAKVISIGWNYRSFDTMAKDEKVLLDKLIKNAKTSSIILLHDNNKFTLAVLEAFIDYCITNGIEIVSLDKMIGLQAYK
ncbi:MAG: peptidoglycan/xylan/chitin deacetylase (PgdA/CDA1 family), partial [Planctomycetota bacterium]